jgi:hypothetical protein
MVLSLLHRATLPIHVRLRAGRCRKAQAVMHPSPSMTLLDVGGTPETGGEFDSLRALFAEVLVVNPDPRHGAVPMAPNVKFELGDGCALPYADESFDWVFSNAVLEHVGDRDKQVRFAQEMQRVARLGYFLSTPNRHFFMDPHTYLPFYHLLSDHAQAKVIRFSLGHMRQWRPLDLVSAKDLRQMFPSAKVAGMGLFRINLIAYESRIDGR